LIYFTSAITTSSSKTFVEVFVITHCSPIENGTVRACNGTARNKSQYKGTEYYYLGTHVYPLSKSLLALGANREGHKNLAGRPILEVG